MKVWTLTLYETGGAPVTVLPSQVPVLQLLIVAVPVADATPCAAVPEPQVLQAEQHVPPTVALGVKVIFPLA
jgi:hypothetical protein